MMKLGATFRTVGTPWDHQGKSEISQIFISSSRYMLDFIQFAYVEDGNVVLSDKIGGGAGSSNLQTITFDYPSEYITRVNGAYVNDETSKKLCSITFYTNKRKYGPYGPGLCTDHFDLIDFQEMDSYLDEFNYEVGGNFWGFFGTCKSKGIESIGLYMKPRQLANRSGPTR
ncbi:Jacalin-type lectin domain-containing protein [Heracleum sosnowskyi]|uniref:Jacalin-type lectin domain-containing protein n=1 Tax=Heracleum sosnowskyi TaxID=360622 RepID=A0AAD8MZ33_9APIA|nr:Jacalin-type lectin domain-containing protein [Heracleum sosnowskyi]